MRLRERKKPDIIKQWQEENLKIKSRVDAIAEEIELKMVLKNLTNACDFEVEANYNYAIPVIDVAINYRHILSISFQRNGIIKTNINNNAYFDADNLAYKLYKEFKPGEINGMFRLSDDKELINFIDSFITHLDINQIDNEY